MSGAATVAPPPAATHRRHRALCADVALAVCSLPVLLQADGAQQRLLLESAARCVGVPRLCNRYHAPSQHPLRPARAQATVLGHGHSPANAIMRSETPSPRRCCRQHCVRARGGADALSRRHRRQLGRSPRQVRPAESPLWRRRWSPGPSTTHSASETRRPSRRVRST